MKVRAISIEGDADAVTLMLIRQVLQAASGRVDLFVQAEKPVERPARLRLVSDDEQVAPAPTPAPVAPPPPAARSVIGSLVARAARETGLNPTLIGGVSLRRADVRARDAVVLAAREQGYSYPQIGRHLGKRDHSTILFAERRAGERLVRDPAFGRLVDQLRAYAAEIG